MDRVMRQGFQLLLTAQEQYLDDFWRRSDVRIKDSRQDRTQRTTVEIQQAIRFNLFHILQAAARAEDTGVPAKGLTGQAYEGHYFWDTEIYLLPFLIYTAPRIARNLLTCRYRMLPQARAQAAETSSVALTRNNEAGAFLIVVVRLGTRAHARNPRRREAARAVV